MEKKFDPNAPASQDSGIFGLPFSHEESQLILVPVPWDLTTSYRAGTASGPQVIFDASLQVDLFDLDAGRPYEKGIFMRSIPEDLASLNERLRLVAERYRELTEENLTGTDSATTKAEIRRLSNEIHVGCEAMNSWVYQESQKVLEEGKTLAVVGGDHSTPCSAIRAISEKFGGDFGILHVDAHADLRKAYEGFTYSHASIMYNVMTASWAPKKLVQVAIRDFCEEEFEFIQDKKNRVTTFFDRQIKQRQMRGEGFFAIAEKIVEELPQQVYVSFDIDGLDPKLCPHTGTPVPGGLSFDEAGELLTSIVRSGRRIIGFDLNEVSNSGAPDGDEWDGNVGARLLYRMCGLVSSEKR